MASYQALVAQVLQEAREPLTLDEILKRVNARQPVTSANPKNTIRNALSNLQIAGSLGDGRYVYVPRALTGSSFRIPVENLSSDNSKLVVNAEVAACLEAAGRKPTYHERQITLTPLGGAQAQVRVELLGFSLGAAGSLDLPVSLRDWIEEKCRAGADALVLRCEDGETAKFALEAVNVATIDHAALAARDERVLATARDICRKNPVYVPDFALRLIVRGAYHGEPQPDPLPYILFELDGRFVVDYMRVTFRPELTPALRRVFADRLRYLQETSVLSPEGLAERLREEEKALLEEGAMEEELEESLVRPRAPAVYVYRLRVRLDWLPSVWRIIEVLDNQTLDDLHEAIQDAFGWDRDHLYAFFLSGKAWDQITQVSAPLTFDPESQPPFTDQVTFADLELARGQHFMYLFDFGDELRHDVEVLEVRPAPSSGDFPRIVEVHGKAPPQYASEAGFL